MRSSGFSATSGSRLFISIRSAASCCHPLQEIAVPRGDLNGPLFIVAKPEVFEESCVIQWLRANTNVRRRGLHQARSHDGQEGWPINSLRAYTIALAKWLEYSRNHDELRHSALEISSRYRPMAEPQGPDVSPPGPLGSHFFRGIPATRCRTFDGVSGTWRENR